MISLLVLAALSSAAGCGDDGDDQSHTVIRDDERTTSLTVRWNGKASAGHRPAGVVLIEPTDAIATKGRVADPTERSTVFTYESGGSMRHGYILDVRRLGRNSDCNGPKCEIYSPNASICSHGVSVKHGAAKTVTVTPQPGGRCKIEVSG
ncbi:MAG: hypothetical protein U0R51_10660 [Solirubrobacterales bacterium]